MPSTRGLPGRNCFPKGGRKKSTRTTSNEYATKREKARDLGINFESEHRVRRVDGAYRWFLCLFRPVRNPAGDIVQWVGSAVDIDDRITEHKTAEDELRKSEERFRLAQQVASIGTFEWNIQTGVNRWSPELEALYGLEPGTFPGTQEAWEFLVHPDDRAEARRQVEEPSRKAALRESGG